MRSYRPIQGDTSPWGHLCALLRALCTAGILLLTTVNPVCAAEEAMDIEVASRDLTEMSIEDLMNIEITSVAKKSQKVSDAAAAIFVITSEDIRRSGATSIPDLLRMVPGIEVARIDANKWAVSSRGFNGRFANKLLVLMDGRSVYNPIYSGTMWDEQDTLLEDVERIEVIRGPGATLWGANAVNGVINIITKHTNETRGGLVSAGGGTEERGFGSVRYGGAASNDLSYRIYTKYFNRDEGYSDSSHDAADDWHALRAGFRIDTTPSDTDSITLQGDIYSGREGETVTAASLDPPYSSTTDEHSTFTGGNLIGKWTRSSLNLQFSYDRSSRDFSMLELTVDTCDLDLQHRFNLTDTQEMIWGLGYRFTHDRIDKNTFYTSIVPTSDNYALYSAFVQDEIMLAGDSLLLTLGSKFEHNSFTGFEVQPNARLIWTPDERNSLWWSVSRAVRTPSRADLNSRLNQAVIPPGSMGPGIPPVLTVVASMGDDDFESEELWAYEMGYRVRPMERLSLDFATFYNDYDKLRSTEEQSFFETSPPPPHAVMAYVIGNDLEAYSYGFELAADYKVCDWWRLQPAYTYLKVKLESSSYAEEETPEHQVSLRSSMNLARNIEFDLWFRYVDELSEQDVDAYSTLDARIGWKPVENLELTVVGQNLLSDQHSEFEPDFLGTMLTEVERGVYAKVTWLF